MGAVIFGAILVLLVFVLANALAIFSNGPYALSVLALCGVIALLGALLIFTTLIHLLELSNKNQALGLPT